MNPFPFRTVFEAVEQRLIEYGSKRLDSAAIRLKLDKFKHFPARQLSDDEYFDVLVMVIFYSVLQGRKFAQATGQPMRYIDIVFVAYGQASSKEYGIDQGICLTKPRCSECAVQANCDYWAHRSVN